MSNEIQILVMTHGNLGRELIKTAAMFVPQTETIGFIGLYEEDSIVVYQEKLSKLLDHSKDVYKRQERAVFKSLRHPEAMLWNQRSKGYCVRLRLCMITLVWHRSFIRLWIKER